VSVETLHVLVTSAIWRAEQLDEMRVSTAPLAWGEVSTLEEQLAAALPVSEPEGRIARRGAVRAALKADDPGRAHALAERYLSEAGVPKALRVALREILADNDRALAQRFRFAARHHAVDDTRDVARRLHQGGAFGLAA
jgi:hypothetical protein